MVKFLLLLFLILMLVLDLAFVSVAVHIGNRVLIARYAMQALVSVCLCLMVTESK